MFASMSLVGIPNTVIRDRVGIEGTDGSAVLVQQETRLPDRTTESQEGLGTVHLTYEDSPARR